MASCELRFQARSVAGWSEKLIALIDEAKADCGFSAAVEAQFRKVTDALAAGVSCFDLGPVDGSGGVLAVPVRPAGELAKLCDMLGVRYD